MSDEQFSILLVDDDEVDRLTIKRALKKPSFLFRLTEARKWRKSNCRLIAQGDNNLVSIPGTNVLLGKIAIALIRVFSI